MILAPSPATSSSASLAGIQGGLHVLNHVPLHSDLRMRDLYMFIRKVEARKVSRRCVAATCVCPARQRKCVVWPGVFGVRAVRGGGVRGQRHSAMRCHASLRATRRHSLADRHFSCTHRAAQRNIVCHHALFCARSMAVNGYECYKGKEELAETQFE
ncbi:hypothetical protein E2C01_029333 [Portunus trituberculatus]|uniref:Uncharacterized protein n=1 Tax=Portunus trituberculatus TaxID=210409 RepID=A0A5B7ER69_PORTR|nr:hypothetical protein [Portunus trituberculatus]